MKGDDKPLTLQSWNQMLKDHYPRPGDRIKQYVVDERREYAWENETAPRFYVDPHLDNCDTECRNCGECQLFELRHDCCAVCDGLYDLAAQSPSAQAWLAEKAKRPAPCADRDKLSDEIEPEYSALSLGWLSK